MRDASIGAAYKAAAFQSSCDEFLMPPPELAVALSAVRESLTRYCEMHAPVGNSWRTPTEVREVLRAEQDLRSHIAILVILWRGRSLPPERIVVLLEEVLSGLPNEPECETRDTLSQRLISWAMDDYFRHTAG